MQILTESYGETGFMALEADELFMICGGSVNSMSGGTTPPADASKRYDTVTTSTSVSLPPTSGVSGSVSNSGPSISFSFFGYTITFQASNSNYR